MQQSALTQRQQQDRDDSKLFQQVQRADQRALASLYDRYAPVLYPLGVRLTGSPEAAADVVHDVFVHVWEQAGTYAPQHGSVYAWLISLSRNKAMERKRAGHQRRRGQGEEPAAERPTPAVEENTSPPETIAVMDSYTEEVRTSLKSLSKLELRLLELSYYEGQSQSDLARMLRIPLGTIKAKMRRGIQKLRQTASPREEGK